MAYGEGSVTSGGVGVNSAGIGPQPDAPLAELARLAVERVPLADALRRLLKYAVFTLPAADGAALAWWEADVLLTAAATDDNVGAVDAAQFASGDGPAVQAAAEGRVIASGAIHASPWAHFGAGAHGAGLRSVLALPLSVGPKQVAVLSLYARTEHAFDAIASDDYWIFSTSAAVVVHNLRLLDRALTQVEELRAAMRRRAIIDQAVGVLRARAGITADEAFARLRRISNNDHVKLAAVAEDVVSEAVRRAARRAKGPDGPSNA